MENSSKDNNSKVKAGKKTKMALLLTLFVLIAMVVVIIWGMLSVLNPPAKLGDMTVTSSGTTITPYTNILKKTVDKVETNYKSVKLEDIAGELPSISYGGDIAVKYSDYTLDDFRFSMYDEKLNELYSDSSSFIHPEKGGTYIVRTQFSWGYNDKNSILTENYYKVIYTDESLKDG